jgi:hypothetical protein
MIDFEAVRTFCASREVDLVLAPPSPPFVLCLHGQFDGYGDFFSILVKDVEFVELAGGFTVGDMLMATELRSLAAVVPRWSRLAGVYSGPALAFRTADSSSWSSDCDAFIVVANHIEWRAGKDWRV